MKNKRMRRRIAAGALAAVTAAAALRMPFFSGTAQEWDAGFDYDMAQELLYEASTASVSVLDSAGALESAYAEWSAVTGAEGYNAYADGTKVDSMLIRQYSDRFRVDVPGLKAGAHTLKIVPIISGKEDASKAAEVSGLNVEAHDRSGFGFVNGSSSGAYNDDGTLKSDAVVVYVTEDTKDTVTVTLPDKKGVETEFTGVQNIITALKSNTKAPPVCIRFIGNITDPSVLNKGDLYVDTASCGLTLEGIGADATANGFGIVLKNTSNAEVRNIGFMNCNSSEGDNCGLQQGNDHIWVHNCDFFYGDAGSDADQVKGDGALDTKTSTYITHSYNHFWDNGKCNLQGMKSEKTENYITYHHNWYDHSDSRHPRIRTCTVHIYNNYFDGNAKYGVGVTMGSSAFVENNYFRGAVRPMMSSGQGTDAKGEGTFSGEDGGIIKAFNNVFAENQSGFSYLTYQSAGQDSDAYEVSSASETVPSSVTTVKGGTTYNNFDTSSVMYQYSADAPEDVPSIVQAKAGRVQGGDFKWQFNNSTDDAKYAVDDALKAALTAYDDAIIAIGSGFTDSTTDPVVTTTKAVETTPQDTTTKAAGTTKPVETKPIETTPAPTPSDGDIYVSPNGTGDGKTAATPTDIYSAVSSLTAGHTIWLEEGTYELEKMILIDADNSGTASAMKSMRNYQNADVVFDFTKQGAANSSNRGIVLNGDYWHFYGFEITKAADNGMLLAGDHNIIERMIFNDNQDTGLQISRYNTNAATIDTWPSYNTILNCTSKNNCDDATMENADGFAAKLTCGEGNVFDGCFAYNNSDDGWDLYAKTETGPIGVVTIRNCIAARNGFTEFGEGFGDCDGNGFKLGGSGVGTAHVVENCLAFENLHCGFTDNNNPKLGSLTSCTAVNNNLDGSGKPNYSCYRCTDPGADFDRLITYYGTSTNINGHASKAVNDKLVGTIQNSIYYNSGYNIYTDKVAIANGAKLDSRVSAFPGEFQNTDALPGLGQLDLDTWRNADGSPNAQGYYEMTGEYKDLGYHFNQKTTPVITTTTQTEQQTTTETTTTTTVSETTAAHVESSTAPVESTTAKQQETTTTAAQTTTEAQITTTEKEVTTTTHEAGTLPPDVDPDSVLYGDVNLDGSVDITDAVLLNKACAQVVTLNNNQNANADCVKDNEVSGKDAIALLRFIVGSIKELPI